MLGKKSSRSNLLITNQKDKKSVQKRNSSKSVKGSSTSVDVQPNYLKRIKSKTNVTK